MNARALVWLAGLCLAISHAGAIDPRQRSESSSNQFVIYSEDVRLRHRVVSFAEEVKGDVLKVLGVRDYWKAPIVIALEHATPEELNAPPARLRMVDTPQGFKVEITVKIGDDPAEVNLQKLIVRAVLLEYAYRESGVQGGMTIVEAPWWVIEGIIQMTRRRELGIDADLYKRLVETNKLPPIERFLVDKPDELGPTALAVDRALALCLLQLLVEQPDGRASLARLVRRWPASDGDIVGLVKKEYPAFADGTGNLQKWWTMNLARFATVDRYRGLSAQETEKALAPLLEFEIPINKAGEKKKFAVGEFEQYLKLPASRQVLAERHTAIVALGTQAYALYRPVFIDYERVFALLAAGKSRGVREQLAEIEEYRKFVRHRITDISDYLNWFEATQMPRSGVFDSYLKTARELSEQDEKKRGPIARYLDQLEMEF